MAARSGSLAWVVLAGAVSIGIAAAMWGVLDSQFLDTLIATDRWSAEQGSTLAVGRQYVILAWNWFLLIVVLRVGIEALVASRLTGATTMLPFATLVLLSIHILLVLWMLTIPEMAQEMLTLATNDFSGALQSMDGLALAVDLAYQWGIGILPSVLLVIADGWYLSSPIRNDMLRRGV
ncbi:hypothetical protein [Haloplanus halophilus]|uniref:hypothetical protein n=1 Tax=Haloplanus halophilus TaxID=2949993 RepID=UPI00204073F7|nr:hypothetical protein [Haloplanus sp. GDY1]